MSYEVRVARPEELAAAQVMLTGQAAISNLVGDGSASDPPTFLVARSDGRLCSAAAIEHRAPELISIVLPLVKSASHQVRERLLDAAVRVASTICKRATVLLLEHEDPLIWHVRDDLCFERAADITFLTCSLSRSRSVATASGSSVEFCSCDEAELTDTIAATLVGSLDCPMLLEVLGAREMLVGFADRAAVHDRYWRLAKQHGRTVGCLLLHAATKADELELMYMGIVPDARGRGLGGALVAETALQARRRRIGHVVLAVDEANAPALRIYREAGFTGFGRRVIWYAVVGRG